MDKSEMKLDWTTVTEDDPQTYPPKGVVCTFMLPKSVPCYVFDGVLYGAKVQDDIHRRSFFVHEIVCWRRKTLSLDDVDRRNERLLRRGW